MRTNTAERLDETTGTFARNSIAELEGSPFVQAAVDLLCVATTDGYFLWLSPSWEGTLGFGNEELTASPFMEFVHPADVDRTNCALSGLRAGEVVIQFENRFRTNEGKYRWLQWNARTTADGRIFAMARDVTDRREAERLSMERMRLLSLAEQMARIGHWRVDLLCNEVYWSDEVYRIHGRDPATYKPTLDESIEAYHPEDRAKVQGHIEQAIRDKAGFDFELRLVRPDGSVRQVVSRGRPEVDDEGEVIALFGVFQDITDRTELNDRLLQTERMASVGTLAAGVAHEVNNPLAYMVANLDVACEELRSLRGAPSLEQLKELTSILQEAREGAERVRRIVHGLQTFSRVDEERREVVDLHSTVSVAVKMAKNEVRHRARLIEELAPVPHVLADDARIAQVVVNLLVNAAHAIPEGRANENEVRVRTFTGVRGDAVLEVSDTGMGIAPENVGRVFEPFFTTKEVGQGTGLGLAICHGIVTGLGGRISVESSLGQGSVFRVVIPPGSGEPAARSHAAVQPRSEDSARILIVDDEPMIGKSLRRILKRDHEVVVETDSRQALRLLSGGENFDVIFCDLMMPTISGMELHDLVDDVAPTQARRMVFMTGGAFTTTARDFLARVDNPRIDKPFDMKQVRKLVQTLARGVRA